MTEEQDVQEIEQMRHALGVQKRGNAWTKPFRNHFVAGEADQPLWESLVGRGLAVRSRRPSELTGGAPCYSVTNRGREIALAGVLSQQTETETP